MTTLQEIQNLLRTRDLPLPRLLSGQLEQKNIPSNEHNNYVDHHSKGPWH
jgi:hypothetical protein